MLQLHKDINYINSLPGIQKQIGLQAILLTEKKLQDYDFEKCYLLIEIQQKKQHLILQNKDFPQTDSCLNCERTKVLDIFCNCLNVAYCSVECLKDDSQVHLKMCRNSDILEEYEKDLIYTSKSVKGVCGLKNIGNTCYMNSGLQCIASITELNDYFLQDKYQNEINYQNPLGTKGELAKHYSYFLKNMHYGQNQIFTPFQIKQKIGSNCQIFQGYNQNDSQELIQYILDGLHEDLNRVTEKKYTESQDFDDSLNDSIISKEYWKYSQARNKSIVVDLLYGQFKSRIECQCSKVSITMDNFIMISLPIPNNSARTLKVYVYDLKPFPQVLTFPVMKDQEFSLIYEIQEQIKTQHFIYYIQYKENEKLIVKEVNDIDLYEVSDKVDTRIICRILPKEEYIKVNKIYIDIYFTKQLENFDYDEEIEQQQVGDVRRIIFSADDTLEDIRKYIQHKFSDIFDHQVMQMQWISNLTQDTFLKNFKFLIKPTFAKWLKYFYIPVSNVFFNCFFCKQNECKNCEVQSEQTKLGQIYEEMLDLSIEPVLQIQILFDRMPRKQSIVNFYQQQEQQIQNNQKDVNIYDCFELFRQNETLDRGNEWYCSNCKEFKQVIKQMQIYSAPKILIIHLKRFKSGNSIFKSKIDQKIDFPVNNLDISEFVLDKSQKSVYNLIAVSNHYGFLGGGHYTAFAKNQAHNVWFEFNDDSVKKISEEDIVSENAYVLFYRRIY